MTKETYKKCIKIAEKYESERRLRHSVGVYEEAGRICDLLKIRGREREDVLTAALLHDVAHDIPSEKQFEIMDRCGVSYDDLRGYPTVLHQRTGAVLAKEELPELSDESSKMIECHTTGKTDMTLGEKIVCLCDFIEPGRENGGCRAVREYFLTESEKISDTEQYEKLIDRALKKAFGMTLEYLKAKGYPIHPVTAEVYSLLCSE